MIFLFHPIVHLHLPRVSETLVDYGDIRIDYNDAH
jgi:hypothetical protein